MTRIERFTHWIVSHPVKVLLLCMVGVMALTAGGQKLTFTNDYRYFFSEKNPHLQAFLNLQETYSSPDTIIWVMQPQGTVAEEGGRPRLATDPDALRVLKELTDAAWQTPHAVRVDSIDNFQHTEATDEELVVSDLVPEMEDIDAAVAHKVHEIATNDPVLVGRAISKDGRTAAVLARLSLPEGELNPNATAVAYARDLQARFREKYPDIRFELTGSSLLSASFSEGAMNDIKTLTPAMYVLIALTVWLLLRSVTATLASMLVIGFATSSAMGSAGWLGIPLSPPSVNAPTIILTVAIADSIHILVTMLVEMRKGLDKNAAIIESMRVNFVPVTLTSLTTAIGFMTLNFSDAPPIGDMGTISAYGAVWAWVLSVVFLPALLAVVPITAKASVEMQSNMMARFAQFVVARKLPLMIGSVVVVAFFGAFVPTIKFNDQFVHYFDDRMDFRVATDFVAENLTSVYELNYSVETGEDSGINEAAYMETVEAFAQFLRAQPEVLQVSAVTDIMKRINKSMHGDREEYFRIPDTREENAQYLLLYEMSLPYGLDLTDQIDVGKSATKVAITLDTPTTSETEALIARINEWIGNWKAEKGVEYTFTNPAGQAVMFGFIGRANVVSMTKGTVVAFLLISAILLVALRSLRLGLISLLPNLMPPLVAFGAMAVFWQAEVGFWAAPIVATALGLIVDATVHILTKYRTARVERGASPEQAVTHAFERTGVALWVSTLVLVIGFGALAFSPFKFNNMMGIMVSANVAIALVLDFLFLPALLMYIDRRKSDTLKTNAAA